LKFLRTVPTRRLILVLVLGVVAVVAAGAAVAVAAGDNGPAPPPKPLDQAIQDALAAPHPDGITARVKFTNNLFPSGALAGNVGSALMTGASGRLWVASDGRARIELQSDAGDVQIVWNPPALSVYDASSNTVYHATLSAGTASAPGSSESDAPPALSQIDDLLSRLGAHAAISAAEPTNVAAQPAYSVTASPKHDGGLLASAELAWDAARGTPLRVAIFAQGSSSPVLQLQVTDISYGSVPASAVAVSPPAGAKVVDLGSLGKGDSAKPTGSPPVTGLDAVQAAAGFPVTAPDALVGLPRQDVRLVQRGDSQAALVVYGHGLGAIVVVERRAGTEGPASGGALSGLPNLSLDGVTAHELATQLGTVLSWQQGGVDYVLAGSLPPAAAEAAARGLA
jgi:hypothetical protein